MMNVDDAVEVIQVMRAADSTLAENPENLRQSFLQLIDSIGGFVLLNPPSPVFDDLNHPRIHPSRVGDPPAQGCEAAPNRKPKPWESVRWQPRTKR